MLRVLELYAGIGGLRCAFPECDLAAAIDINEKAAEVYRSNFSDAFWVREIESLHRRELQLLDADLWWMSPPCQPYSRRGRMQDMSDSRAASFLHLLSLLDDVRPAQVLLENVPGFENSASCQLLCQQLSEAGYRWQSIVLCPTQLGWPNLRKRFYLWASLGELRPWRSLPTYDQSLSSLLKESVAFPADDPIWVEPDIVERFREGFDVVSSESQRAACFGSSYGKSILRAGSYLELDGKLRRFSPEEVTILMGFPASFKIAGVARRTAWKLLGNSLSLPVVRYLISHLSQSISPILPWMLA